MPKVLEREEPKDNTFITKVSTFLSLRSRIDDMTKEKSVIQAELSDLVDTTGEPDEKGSLWLHLPHEVDGYTALQRQRKVSQVLDQDEAESILKSKGLFDRCYEMQPVLKEDEVMAAHFEGLITEAEIDKMFPNKVSWAFVPKKA
jgi:hypothetical protein